MPHTMPALIDGNFIVDSTNGNGLGIRSLKGSYVANVFMHTSATPGIGNGNVLNPNPAPGYIVVQLTDNYNRNISGFNAMISPLSGSNITVSTGSALTVGNAYVVTSTGTTTTADWIALGVPPSMLATQTTATTTAGQPQVGLAFIAAATSAGTGSGTVQTPSNSGITNIETVGDPNTTIAPIGTPGLGAQIILQCLKNGTLTAPNNNTVISIAQLESNSQVNSGINSI